MGLTEMKCPACGAPLKFSASSGKVECEYCGTVFEIADLIPPEAPKKEQAAQAAQNKSAQPAHNKPAQGQSLQKNRQEGDTFEYNWGDAKHSLHLEPLEDAKGYICKSCGAELVTTATTASLKCPYCDNEVVLDERISGSVKPNGIIPFRIDAKQLPELLKNFYKKKPLLPNNFFDAHRISETQGVYVPYWLFSGNVDARLSMQGARIRHYTQGDYDCTETSYYDVDRAGNLGFAGVPVDGHSKVDNIVTESLEPYDLQDLREFQSPYLAGYVTDRFDADPSVCIPRAQERMYASTEATFKQTAPGYDRLTVKNGYFDLRNTVIKYVLLPAYFIKCEYNGKSYRFAINGQTGKVVGELPIDKKKQHRAFWGGFAAAAAAAFAVCMLFV